MPSANMALLCGKWLNANRRSKGIIEIEIHAAEGVLRLRALACSNGQTVRWEEVPVEVFSCTEEDSVSSLAGLSFCSVGSMEVEFQIRINKGILAVTTFHQFKDGGESFDYVTRELYYRTET